MAKTASNKIKSHSIRSRAAKRASSPSINTDKSLKNVKLPSESTNYRPTILAVHQGAGVTKKSKNGRKSVLSAKAKRRQEKDQDRAEAVMDKQEKRVEVSNGRARTVHERSRAWDELNRRMIAQKARHEAMVLGKENWIDEEVANEPDEFRTAALEDSKTIDAASVRIEFTAGDEVINEDAIL